MAAGFYKKDGKHVSTDGLVSRRGYRRIVPAGLDEDGRDGELWADNAQQLAELYKQVLRGRNATVFENLVIKPLLGQKGMTVAELARRFGVDEDRIYRCKYDALQRINRVSAKLKTFPNDPKLTQMEIGRRERQHRQLQSELKSRATRVANPCTIYLSLNARNRGFPLCERRCF